MIRKLSRSVLLSGLLAALLGLAAWAAEQAGETPAPKPGETPAPQAERTWTDASGTSKVVATFVRREGDVVILRDAKGALLAVPLGRLSEADRAAIPQAAPPAAGDKPVGDKPALGEIQKNLLVASLSTDAAKSTSAALLIRKDKKYAYVLIPAPTEEFAKMIYNRGTQAQTLKAEVRQALGEANEVAAENLGMLPRERMILFRTAAEALDGTGLSGQPQIAKDQNLKLLGARKSGVRWIPVELSARVEHVHADKAGQPSSFGIIGQLDAAPDLGLLLNEQGYVVGIMSRLSDGGRGELQGRPVQRLLAFGAPLINFAAAAPVQGDDETIEYEFAVDYSDPLEQLGKPRLAVLRLPAGKQPTPNEGKLEGPGVEVIALDQEPLHPLHQGVSRPDNKVLRARLKLPNTSDPDSDHFAMQLRGQKDALYSPIAYAEFRSTFRKKGDLPRIPGLDGIVNGPRLTALDKGQWKLTSNSGQVNNAKPAVPASQIFPPAVKRPITTIKTETPMRDDWKSVLLSIPVTGGLRTKERPLVYSPDGEYFYVIDKDQVLRKVRSSDLMQTASRDLENGSTALAHSKSNLLVKRETSLVVLDPETLATVFDFETDRLQRISASAAHDTAFALERRALVMLDVKGGKVLHRVPTIVKSEQGIESILTLNEIQIFRDVEWLRQDSQGKFLYASGDQFSRFRVEGGHLIYEGSLRDKPLVLSDDGTRMVLASKDYQIKNVLDPRDFKQLNNIKIDYPQCGAFLLPDNEFWACTGAEFYIFKPDGSPLRQFASGERPVEAMWANPQGGQAVIWADQSLYVQWAPKK